MLDPALAAQLTDDDDPALWDVATNAIRADAASTGRDAKKDLFAQIGTCRHWIRPHGSRWAADGGFAAPFGYDKTTTGYSFRALPDIVHGNKELFEKLGRNDLCPCGSGKRFRRCCLKSGCF